jgi:hypothetical protein
MGAFFRTAIGDHLLNDAPAILDWLFDDKKFNNKHWTMGTKRKLTNRISKLDGFSPSAFAKKTGGNEYPKIQSKRNRKRQPYAIFSSSESLGQDFIRHIRNGIAHGQAEFYNVKGVSYIQITDKGTKGQSAFIAMPISHLERIYQIYQEINKDTGNYKKGKKQ